MPINPKVSIDDLPSVFDAAQATFLELAVSTDLITPASQNIESGLFRTLQQRLSLALINVREFGVVGDGVTLDNTALVTAFANGAATYFLPPGTYALSGNVAVPTGSLLIGSGVTLTGGVFTGTYNQIGIGGTAILPAPIGNAVGTLDDTGTPSVTAGKFWITGGTTTITNFTGGVLGQELWIRSSHLVTVTANANIETANGSDFDMEPGRVMQLAQWATGVWTEVTRRSGGG